MPRVAPLRARRHTYRVDEAEREQEESQLPCMKCGSTRVRRAARPGAEKAAQMPPRYVVSILVCSNCGGTAFGGRPRRRGV